MLQKFGFLTLGLLLAFSLAPAARADTITFTFPGSHTGELGTSQSFTSGGVTITAYGFSSEGRALNLFGKTAGGDETGLGIAGAPHDEIQTNNFIQLDLANLQAKNPTAFNLLIGSVQKGEGWNIYGSNTLGDRGTVLLASGVTDYPNSFSLTQINFRYISVQASSADVLLNGLSATTTTPTPEPATMLLLGTGLAGLAAKVRRRRQSTESEAT